MKNCSNDSFKKLTEKILGDKLLGDQKTLIHLYIFKNTVDIVKNLFVS